jgi:hypothetical protein
MDLVRLAVDLHALVLGYAVIGSWAVIALWSLALRFTRHEDTPTFWRAVSLAQILLFAQVVAGVVLLLLFAFGAAGLPGDGSAFDVSFHLLYGAGFPLVVLVFAHKWAREGRYDPHTVFAVAGLVIFGLTARAWQVGAG